MGYSKYVNSQRLSISQLLQLITRCRQQASHPALLLGRQATQHLGTLSQAKGCGGACHNCGITAAKIKKLEADEKRRTKQRAQKRAKLRASLKREKQELKRIGSGSGSSSSSLKRSGSGVFSIKRSDSAIKPTGSIKRSDSAIQRTGSIKRTGSGASSVKRFGSGSGSFKRSDSLQRKGSIKGMGSGSSIMTPNKTNKTSTLKQLDCSHWVCSECASLREPCSLCVLIADRRVPLRSSKTDKMQELVTDILNKDPTDKIIIFAHWTTYLDLIERQLSKHGIAPASAVEEHDSRQQPIYPGCPTIQKDGVDMEAHRYVAFGLFAFLKHSILWKQCVSAPGRRRAQPQGQAPNHYALQKRPQRLGALGYTQERERGYEH